MDCLARTRQSLERSIIEQMSNAREHSRIFHPFLLIDPSCMRVWSSADKAMQVTFESAADLSNILSAFKIDTSLYGVGTSKSVHQLFKELQQGECTLSVQSGVLVRSVSVLLLAIRRADGRVLTEVNQTFHQTPDRAEYSRQRNILLAEKILPGESVPQATERAIKEELGISCSKRPRILLSTRDTEKKYSQSYPQLLCSYDTIRVDVDEQSLPTRIPDGYTFTEHFPDGGPRVTATWEWTRECM